MNSLTFPIKSLVLWRENKSLGGYSSHGAGRGGNEEMTPGEEFKQKNKLHRPLLRSMLNFLLML